MAFRTFIAALAISASLTAPAFAQDVAAAKTALAGDYDRIVKELITITEIPAPPFGEQARAAYFAKAFKDMGLTDVAIDAEGNVTGIRRGTVAPGGPLVVISAHLDTVFPKGTNVTVRREGNTLNAPGVGDDTVGLTGMLAWIRAMNAAKVPTRHDILFVGTVGEEGPGDLRGVRYLFTKSAYKDRIAGFISVDGPDPSRIVNQAVGSKRYNIAFTGPGGHSYGAFGIVNPMAAMADAVKRLYETDVPASPRTSFAASVVSGGTSVNSIPDRIELQVDMRSPDPGARSAGKALPRYRRSGRRGREFRSLDQSGRGRRGKDPHRRPARRRHRRYASAGGHQPARAGRTWLPDPAPGFVDRLQHPDESRHPGGDHRHRRRRRTRAFGR